MTRPSQPSSRQPSGLHPRNRHPGRYDFDALIRVAPELRGFMRAGVHGQPTLDFANPQAVRLLNGALLLTQYDIKQWAIPPGYLCPPVPGRADYIHALADLLTDSHDGVVPVGEGLIGLDVGTGANLIYPLIGQVEYRWRFIAADIDVAALDNAERILAANPSFDDAVSLRLQPDPQAIFENIIGADESVDFTLCNPPFHRNADEAHDASRKKWKNLRGSADPSLNFGGQHNELFCEDGESGFLQRMADQSVVYRGQVFWFSSLVSKQENVAPLQERVKALGATDVRVIAMAQGNKRSRFVAWTFLDKKQRRAWRRARWP